MVKVPAYAMQSRDVGSGGWSHVPRQLPYIYVYIDCAIIHNMQVVHQLLYDVCKRSLSPKLPKTMLSGS